MKVTPKFYIWLRCAGIRAIKTIAQTIIASIGTAVVLSDVDWKYIFSASILAGILSILTSIAGLPEVEFKEEERTKEEARKLNAQN